MWQALTGCLWTLQLRETYLFLYLTQKASYSHLRKNQLDLSGLAMICRTVLLAIKSSTSAHWVIKHLTGSRSQLLLLFLIFLFLTFLQHSIYEASSWLFLYVIWINSLCHFFFLIFIKKKSVLVDLFFFLFSLVRNINPWKFCKNTKNPPQNVKC